MGILVGECGRLIVNAVKRLYFCQAVVVVTAAIYILKLKNRGWISGIICSMRPFLSYTMRHILSYWHWGYSHSI
jgi:hypothetical protein